MSTGLGKECGHIRAILPDFSVGKCSARAGQEIRRHVDACPACASELRALERTAMLLEETPLEPAPDLWDAIRPSLSPREAPSRVGRMRWWVLRHKVQSAMAAAAAILVVAGMLVTGPKPSPTPDAHMYLTDHATMSWREPFADKAGLGLAVSMPVHVSTEESQ